MIVIASLCLLLAGIACFTFFDNLRIYKPASPAGPGLSFISVLIPARDEELNIVAAVDSVLAASGSNVRVIVADDHSTDRTAELVKARAAQDERVRVIAVPDLPAGWNGKQHACWHLAQAAETELLLFIDADVRLEPGALERMALQLRRSGASLLSGVPRQVYNTWLEQLLIPLIHSVLLAYLPMRRMRASVSPAYAAGCGQLFLCRAEDYRTAGGHAAIRGSMHDGLTLPRAFRIAGMKTDLFDATDVASCRMYSGSRQVLAGLTKNAVEGLAKPSRIVVFTLLFGLGQILPLPLAIAACVHGRWIAFTLLLGASLASYTPRVASVRRFRQPTWSALAHPVGMLLLTVIQWLALASYLAGKNPSWKGRSYDSSATPVSGGTAPSGDGWNPLP